MNQDNHPNAAADQPRRSFLTPTVRLGPVVKGLVVAACLPAWLALLARWAWLAELCTHFVWQYAALLPLVLVVAWVSGWRRLTLVAAVTLAICVVRLAPRYLPTEPAAPAGPTVRLLSLNVLTSNRQHDGVLQLIETEDPDVVVLLEVNDRWVDAMRPLEDRYTTHAARTRADNFGVAVYTRLETPGPVFQVFGDGEVPSVVLPVEWGGGFSATVIGAHPLPPSSERTAAIRNRQLAATAAFAADCPGACVVIGDLNITPYSPYFADLLQDGGLRDSSRGRGVEATWFPKTWFLGLPIDHALHTPDLTVVDRRVGPDVGSDHRAVIVDLATAAE